MPQPLAVIISGFLMHQNTLLKFTLFISLSVTLLAACSSPGPVSNLAGAEPTEPPFTNEEPEKYQTFIVQTTPKETVRFFVARDGDKWRVDSAYGTPSQTTSLHTDKDYILAYEAKAYSEYDSTHGFDERPNMVQEISYGMLNSRDKAVYEEISSEAGVAKFRFIDARGKESVVTFDKENGLPIKKEIFSINDGAKTLEITISLEGLLTEVDPGHFEIPKEFKKASAEEMKKILTTR